MASLPLVLLLVTLILSPQGMFSNPAPRGRITPAHTQNYHPQNWQFGTGGPHVNVKVKPSTYTPIAHDDKPMTKKKLPFNQPPEPRRRPRPPPVDDNDRFLGKPYK
ncbi:hypothetical protein RIF29_13577 [Crotalaria pallida]|uniref:Uncharacterized protein n=1 Tax=Crotalaria pallida TaxID=3830 RepID=A0AAN9IPF3_CROPI